jgi:60S ribosome subunit biogenesis protein NIP7
MKFRCPTRGERRLIMRAGREFGGDFEAVLDGKILLVSVGGRREVFVTNPSTYEVLERLKVNPYFTGLYIGEIRDGRFNLGLEGGYLLAPSSNRRIIVDDSVEQLVLYGRDVFINSIREAYPGMKKGQRCLILNRRGEFLAVGKVEGKIIKNLLDRGWYLRKGE